MVDRRVSADAKYFYPADLDQGKTLREEADKGQAEIVVNGAVTEVSEQEFVRLVQAERASPDEATVLD